MSTPQRPRPSSANPSRPAIDLQKLAEKIVERLRRELDLERERSGR